MNFSDKNEEIPLVPPQKAPRPPSGQAPKAKDNSALFDVLGTASTMGLHMVSGPIVGAGLGWLVDKWLGSWPVGAGIGLIFGIVAGFRIVWVDAKHIIRQQNKLTGPAPGSGVNAGPETGVNAEFKPAAPGSGPNSGPNSLVRSLELRNTDHQAGSARPRVFAPKAKTLSEPKGAVFSAAPPEAENVSGKKID